jgi:hypothetical protein
MISWNVEITHEDDGRWLIFRDEDDIEPSIREWTDVRLWTEEDRTELVDAAKSSGRADSAELIREEYENAVIELAENIATIINEFSEFEDTDHFDITHNLCWFDAVPWGTPTAAGFLVVARLDGEIEDLLSEIKDEGESPDESDQLLLFKKEHFPKVKDDEREVVLTLEAIQHVGQEKPFLMIRFTEYIKKTGAILYFKLYTHDLGQADAMVVDLEALMERTIITEDDEN